VKPHALKEATAQHIWAPPNVPSECLFRYVKARMKGKIVLAGGIPDEQVAQECMKPRALQGPKSRRRT
jgi:hypothetical protein